MNLIKRNDADKANKIRLSFKNLKFCYFQHEKK